MDYYILLKKNNYIIRDTLKKLGYRDSNILMGNFKEGKYLVATPSKLIIGMNQLPKSNLKLGIINCKEDTKLFLGLAKLQIENNKVDPLKVFDSPILAVDLYRLIDDETINLLRNKYLEISESVEDRKYVMICNKLFVEGKENLSHIYLDYFDPDIYISCGCIKSLMVLSQINEEEKLYINKASNNLSTVKGDRLATIEEILEITERNDYFDRNRK